LKTFTLFVLFANKPYLIQNYTVLKAAVNTRLLTYLFKSIWLNILNKHSYMKPESVNICIASIYYDFKRYENCLVMLKKYFNENLMIAYISLFNGSVIIN
jgi:hypothetical protein